MMHISIKSEMKVSLKFGIGESVIDRIKLTNMKNDSRESGQSVSSVFLMVYQYLFVHIKIVHFTLSKHFYS